MGEGLEGVIAADTALSLSDPPSGRLWVRGVPVEDLVARYGYEGTVALLWDGLVAAGLTRTGVHGELGAARVAAYDRLQAGVPNVAPREIERALRSCLAALPRESSPAAITATLAVAVPALIRVSAGLEPVPPDPALSTAVDVLRMAHGATPEPLLSQALDTYFTAMADSGFSPSTFAGRVIASTGAGLPEAVLGAWCAFTGPLHGGAPGPTLDLLDELAAASDMAALIELKLSAGERLMGFGHRVFRGNDPRAAAIRAALERMGPAASRLDLAKRAEACVAVVVDRLKPGRRLPANVEIMAALLLDGLGIPRESFTAVFAIARCPSWIAHALEQQRSGRMFRPGSRYVGPPTT